MLKAVTLYEPWASLMAIGAKLNETRGCRTNHRGDIAIHAAKADVGTPEEIIPIVIQAFRSRNIQPSASNMGCVLAVVRLMDVIPSAAFFRGSLYNRHQHEELMQNGRIPLCDEEYAFGNYMPGRFIYRCCDVRRLLKPIPCRGYQQIGWIVPPEIEAQIRKQLPGCSHPGCGYPDGKPCHGCGRIVYAP